MTDLRKFAADLRALHEAATPGPWRTNSPNDYDSFLCGRVFSIPDIDTMDEVACDPEGDDRQEDRALYVRLRNAAPAIANMAGLLADCRDATVEARDSVRASRVEDGISANRRAYREDLEERLTALLRRVDALEVP